MPRDLLNRRRRISESTIAETEATDLTPGQVRVAVDRFAITANNITYGAYGNAYKYWAFFPAPDDWGRVPVWGFATVVESESDDVEIGERLYGFWPMSESFVIEPVRVKPTSLTDGTEHRQPLPAVYNN